MLEVAPGDLEWADGSWRVRGDPEQARSTSEIAMAAHSGLSLPDGVDSQLDASAVYDPPNLTFPFGAYICVTDVDPGTGQVQVRRFIAVDDCGGINPMIVEGRVHRGIADGMAWRSCRSSPSTRLKNRLGGSPWTTRCPRRRSARHPSLALTVTPRRITRSARRGSATPPWLATAVVNSCRRVARSACGTPTCRDPGRRVVRHSFREERRQPARERAPGAPGASGKPGERAEG
jgi:carbon-monoxide dehydrogenase large subunit